MPATEDKYAPTTWGSAYEELTVPSGQICLVQKISMTELISEDMASDFDILSKLVQTEHVSKKSRGSGKAPGKVKQAESQTGEILSDAENIRKMLRMMNTIVAKVVVQPEIHPAPERDEEGNLPPRENGKVYIDQIADGDKSFIMQWAFGGTRDLERFRQELEESAAGLADVEGMAHKAK